MIEWRDSLALGALVLAPALWLFFVWAFRERDRALATFVDADLHPSVLLGTDRRRRQRRALALTAAVVLLAIALAGPMWGFHWEEVRREGIDLIVAIDTSKSMLASDVRPNRLARAKLAVEDLLAEIQGDRIGLVAFAGTAFLQCPLTLDRSAFRESLDAVEVGLIPRGGTNLQAALEVGLAGFEARQGRHQALVLITDGEGHEGDLAAVTKASTERGIKVYTVGIGTSAGELIPVEGGYLKDRKGQVVKSRLDEETLKGLALDTGGVYLHAEGTDLGLTALYRDHIATMEKRDLASTLERRYEHRFQIPLALAMLLLIVEALGSPGAWRRRSPALALALWSLGATGAGWLDPHATAREAARLYGEGKFDDAAAKYREALVDAPDSSLLHLNLAATAYRQGKYEDALAALGGVVPSDARPHDAAHAAYDAGNANYRLGAATEASKPEAALGLYAEALAAYRRAMGADPADEDAKFNHEFVEKKIAELRKKLEEQKNEQQQQQQQKDQQQQDQEQNQERQQGQEQQQAPQQREPKPPAPEEQAGEDRPPPREPEQQNDAQGAEGEQQPGRERAEPPPPAAVAGAPAGDEPDDAEQRDAGALLDAQRDQEVRPDEMIRRLQGAEVLEPREDW